MAKRGSEATERGLLLVHQGSVQWRIVGHQRIGGGAPSTGVARIFQQGEGRVAKRGSEATERGLLCVHQGSVQWRIVGHQRIGGGGGGGVPSTGVASIFQQGEGRGGKARERSDRAGFAPCASRLCAVAYSGSSTHWGGGHRALA